MNSQHLALDHRTQPRGDRSRAYALSQAVTLPVRNPIAQLSDALQILATQLHEAVAQRRSAPPAGELYRRADERVAYLNELYIRLQRSMEIPPEVWLLNGGRAPIRDQRSSVLVTATGRGRDHPPGTGGRRANGPTRSKLDIRRP